MSNFYTGLTVEADANLSSNEFKGKRSKEGHGETGIGNCEMERNMVKGATRNVNEKDFQFAIRNARFAMSEGDVVNLSTIKGI
jgi:hypothetical protein